MVLIIIIYYLLSIALGLWWTMLDVWIFSIFGIQLANSSSPILFSPSFKLICLLHVLLICLLHVFLIDITTSSTWIHLIYLSTVDITLQLLFAGCILDAIYNY